MPDLVRTLAREPDHLYFVRGDVRPPPQLAGIESDFGSGLYAWGDSAENADRAAEWARRKARDGPGLVVPRLYLLAVAKDVLAGWRILGLRTPAGELDVDRWQHAVGWYRARDAGPGPLEEWDLVSGPLAVGRRPYRPKLDVPDQYRFLFRVQRHLRVVAEDEL